MQLLAAAGALVWFALNGLLWYSRPSDLLWLLGSAALGVIFFASFLGYLALCDKSTKLSPRDPRAGAGDRREQKATGDAHGRYGPLPQS